MTGMSLRILSIAIIGMVAAADEPVVEARLTPPESPFHRAGHFTLIVEGPSDLDCEFPELTAEASQIEITSMPTEIETTDTGGIRHTRRYVLDAVFPGHYVVPPVQIVWKYGETEGRVTVPASVFHARELTQAEQEQLAHLADIAAPADLLSPRRFSVTHGVAALLILTCVVAVVAVIFWRRLGRGEHAVPRAPAWEIALHRLRELKQRDLPGAGKIDAYYVDLSSILRYYIEDRFHIHAPEQTTPEFLETAAQLGVFTDDQQCFLSEFLRQCDCVKFAGLTPGAEEMTTHFSQVKHFVQDTVPSDDAGATSLEQAA